MCRMYDEVRCGRSGVVYGGVTVVVETHADACAAALVVVLKVGGGLDKGGV